MQRFLGRVCEAGLAKMVPKTILTGANFCLSSLLTGLCRLQGGYLLGGCEGEQERWAAVPWPARQERRVLDRSQTVLMFRVATSRLSAIRQVQVSTRTLATVAVGISGGVDSSVAAMLLKEQGHDVVGVHMSNWDVAEEGHESCGEQDARDAHRVCDKLGIGFHRTSFVREYWTDVFEPLLQGYQAGGTPNPDVACNRHIKFDRFVTHALALGADRVATGHYARVEHRHGYGSGDAGSCADDDDTRLLMAIDAVKDQSYFLAAVRQWALRLCDFPIGYLHKDEVRQRAAAAGLHTASKRDSTGICFIGKRRFADFLEGYLPQAPGPFVCVDSGCEVGQHRGYALYTPGQRARVGGMHARWYVVDKDADTNVVRICEGSDHPALFARSLLLHPSTVSWISGAPPAEIATGSPLRCRVRVRHPGELHECTMELEPDHSLRRGALRITLDQPVRGIAELQAVAFYMADVCLGGATIWERGPTLWDEARALRRVGYSGGSNATRADGPTALVIG